MIGGINVRELEVRKRLFYLCSHNLGAVDMVRQKFGSAHTERKLRALEAYLKSYTTALKNRRLKLVFFDAFAGTGQIELSQNDAPLIDGADVDKFVDGSARRALQCKPQFDEYIFVEKSVAKVRELEKLKLEFPSLADRIQVIRGDANENLRAFCHGRNWKEWRAVVFLDPCGNQVAWETIVSVSGTQAIDLWYLFPAGLGVYRQISRTGSVDKTHEASLDQLMGTSDWRNAFLEEQPKDDLFDGMRTTSQKIATPDSITRFMIKRMQGIFKGGVLDDWLPLGSKGIHMYSLLFAWANPSAKAKLAGKLAAAVLRSQGRGRTK